MKMKNSDEKLRVNKFLGTHYLTDDIYVASNF